MTEARTSLHLGVWPVRTQAEHLGALVAQRLSGELFRPWLLAEPQKAQFQLRFEQCSQWVLVMAAGIATRFLGGVLRDKHQDPAVVVLDEAGRYAIAVLGGHEAGGNALAYRVAEAVGAIPVVTTATEAVKPLVAGIGCRKGISPEQIERAVRQALGTRELSALRELATIELKAREPGLLAFSQRHGIPMRVIATEQIASRPWVTRSSDWVRQNVGIDGVCEPCALIACTRGRLVVPKTSLDGVAVALVEDSSGCDR